MDSNIITIDFNNLFKEKYKNKYGIYLKFDWSTVQDVINFLKDELNLKDLDLLNEDGIYLGGFNSLEMLKHCKELKAIYQKSEDLKITKQPCFEQNQQHSSNENEAPKRVNRKRKPTQLSNAKIEIKNLDHCSDKSESNSSQILKHIIFDDDGNDIRNKVIFKDMCASLTSKPRFFTGYVLSNKTSLSDKEEIDNSESQSLD